LNYGSIAPLREIDQDLIIPAFCSVIFLELRTEPAGLNSYDGIRAGIKGIVFVKDGCPDMIFLEFVPLTPDELIDREAQKAAQALGLSKGRACQNSLQFLLNKLGRDSVGRLRNRSLR
jgi:hypothetical protein